MVRKLQEASASDQRRIEADIKLYGSAFYRIGPDGVARHVPIVDVLADPVIGT